MDCDRGALLGMPALYEHLYHKKIWRICVIEVCLFMTRSMHRWMSKKHDSDPNMENSITLYNRSLSSLRIGEAR